jgi:hypothetical protein
VEVQMLARSILATAAIGIAVGLMGAATGSAQTPGVTYCQALADKYERYAATTRMANGQPLAPAHTYAISRCNAGDSASSTPVLEKTLRQAGIGLPEHN